MADTETLTEATRTTLTGLEAMHNVLTFRLDEVDKLRAEVVKLREQNR